jgi:hypothetical protein
MDMAMVRLRHVCGVKSRTRERCVEVEKFAERQEPGRVDVSANAEGSAAATLGLVVLRADAAIFVSIGFPRTAHVSCRGNASVLSLLALGVKLMGQVLHCFDTLWVRFFGHSTAARKIDATAQRTVASGRSKARAAVQVADVRVPSARPAPNGRDSRVRSI